MRILGLSPIEWGIIITIALLVSGIGALPEYRAVRRPKSPTSAKKPAR